jgi:antitoxin (DNA-binding transcriptional repressor) of toxin-antitoxin stability system
MAVAAADWKELPQRLRDLVDEASRSGEIVLTHDGGAVAKIITLRRARAPHHPAARGA